jgi:uncharacterized RDD family membrane protein YckC
MARKQRDDDSDDDPLGKLLQRHQVSLAAVLVVSGVFLLVGLGLLVFALTRDPYSLTFLLIGMALLLLSVVMLGMNVFNVGRRFELRKLGVRFVESGIVTELLWSDIAEVVVNRTDDTYLGVASVRRRSADAADLSGPLTKMEWDVTIVGHDGRSIRLRPMFLRTVSDPKKLISQLRLRAGIP